MRAVCLALLSLALASPAMAGDADFIPTLINMTPDGSDGAARECATALRRALRSNWSLAARGESSLRRSVVEGGDAAASTSDFFEWQDSALDAVALEAYAQGNHEGGAALILFDCRPSDQVFRLILVPVGPGNVRAQLRGPLMSTERAVRTMTGLLRYVGVGWYP